MVGLWELAFVQSRVIESTLGVRDDLPELHWGNLHLRNTRSARYPDRTGQLLRLWYSKINAKKWAAERSCWYRTLCRIQNNSQKTYLTTKCIAPDSFRNGSILSQTNKPFSITSTAAIRKDGNDVPIYILYRCIVDLSISLHRYFRYFMWKKTKIISSLSAKYLVLQCNTFAVQNVWKFI